MKSVRAISSPLTQSLIATLLTSLIVGLVISCSQPTVVTKRWGWEHSSTDKTSYEESLFSAYDKENYAEAKNEWRVLNYMMYFLATELAKAEDDRSKLAKQIEQLQGLNTRIDSAEVMALYRNIFIDYDTRLDKSDRNSNQLIDSVLTKVRLPQILMLGAFDRWWGLDGLGKLITRVGPLEFVKHDGDTVFGYGQDGIHYEAIQDNYGDYVVVAGSDDGPVDKRDRPKGSKLDGDANKTRKLMSKANLLEGVVKTQHTMQVQTSYATVNVQRVNILGLPGPKDVPVSQLGDQFFASEWDARTIDLELYFNIEDITQNDSIDFTVSYTISDPVSGDSLAGEEKRFQYAVADLNGEAFSARILTEPIPDIDSCRVDLTVACNETYFTHSELLNFDDGGELLEIARADIRNNVKRIPFVNRDPIPKSDSLPLLLTLSDIPFDSATGGYSCLAVVLLFDSKQHEGEAGIDPTSFAVLGEEDSLGMPESDLPNLFDLVEQYGSTYLEQFKLNPPFPNSYLTLNLAPPDRFKAGRYLLKIDYYRVVDYDRMTIKRFATVSRTIRLE